MSIIIFMGACLTALIIIITVLPQAQSDAEFIIYYLGIIMVSLMLGVSGFVYVFYYMIKTKVTVVGIVKLK